MNKTIFDYQDYKLYLRETISSQPKRGRGIRSKLAETVGCKNAYVSQVLNGPIDFNLEQAVKVNRFFGHSKDESHYFMLLIQYSRAGDESTRQYFREQIDEQIAKRLVIKNRLGLAQELSEHDQITYYSAWHYSAVHILTTIPAYQSKRAMANHLGLSLQKTTAILDFLLRTGLVDQKGDRFLTGRSKIHLGNESPLISKHHANWRIKAVQSLEDEKKDDLHYSGIFSLSLADSSKIKSMLVKAIEEAVSVVKASPEEKLSALCLDFFEV